MTTLEKIRAEIRQKQWHIGVDSANQVIELIDKYAEQEPCDDAVSRQYLLDLANKDEAYDYVSAKEIAEAPPVRPQEPKTGHWIEHNRETLREMGYYRCSECNHGYRRYERGVRKSEVPYINGQKYELHKIDNYCPNCGAKMESEDK